MATAQAAWVLEGSDVESLERFAQNQRIIEEFVSQWLVAIPTALGPLAPPPLLRDNYTRPRPPPPRPGPARARSHVARHLHRPLSSSHSAGRLLRARRPSIPALLSRGTFRKGPGK